MLDRCAVLLGRRVHELRRARGHTLVQLAAHAGLSHSFLSQLERGLARPSMVPLERIARALGSSQVELLAGLRDEPAPRATQSSSGSDFFEHADDEFLTLVEGAPVVDLGDGVVHELGAGDSLYCVGGTPHRWRSASAAPYRLFLVKENPRRP